MWRRIHILEPVQSFVLGTLCAAIMALPFAIRSVAKAETALLRDFFWPHQFEPYLVFSAYFLGVLFILLGYYHLGRLGVVLSAGLGFALALVMAVCAMLSFVWVRSLWLSTVTYTLCVLSAYALMFWLHKKATASATVRDAQRKMGLVRGEVAQLL